MVKIDAQDRFFNLDNFQQLLVRRNNKMDKDPQLKEFLEQQIQWCKSQDHILEEIDIKLYEMKRIAEYALEHEFNSEKAKKLNGQLNELINEVHCLEKQLRTIVH
ncbi:hypothetical protein [Bacillus timonensis]|nr:hypothetical protein [Bacillus timonensis]